MGGGLRYPSRGILAPTPYSKPQSRGKMPKINKNCFSEHRTTVVFQFMMFYGLNSIYQGGGGQDTPAGVSWPPPLIPGQKVDFFFFLLITHKNCFSEHLTTVLPVFDVLMVITVYIWVGAKIPQRGFLDPPPPHNLFQAKKHRTTVIFQFMMFYGLNSIYQVGGQDTPAGVSWPPPLIPGQKVDFFFVVVVFFC